MVSVGPVVVIVGLSIFVGVVALGVLAIRHQSRMFPKGLDRTGWNPNGDNAGWFRTKFTWLSGGRG